MFLPWDTINSLFIEAPRLDLLCAMDDERRDHGRFQGSVVGENPRHGAARGCALSDDAWNRNEITTFRMTDRSGNTEDKSDTDVLSI